MISVISIWSQITLHSLLLANRHLADSILRQHVTYISNHENIKAISNAISLAKNTKYKKIQADLKVSLPPCISIVYNASEKGASSLLTGRPLEVLAMYSTSSYFKTLSDHDTKQSCSNVFVVSSQHSWPHTDLQERTLCELQAQQDCPM